MTKMLQFHKEKNADATIAVIEVPLEEASRFGIMNTNDDLSIYEFEEKPQNQRVKWLLWEFIYLIGKY